MRKIYFSLFALLIVFVTSAQQTILIDPIGDGGFENGTSFAANGWTPITGATNQWFVGNVSTPSAGTNAAYISSNVTGTTYNYTITSSSVVYFYRDITFPAGETNIQLSFKWKAQGEANSDWICVWSAPTTVTPTVNLPVAASQSWNSIATTYSGAVIHSTPPNLNLQGAAYQTQNVCLPASYAGTTRRLVFMWSNNASVGTQGPGSVDEISLVSSVAPVTPAAQPTALVLTAISTSQIDGSFTATSPASTGYIVVRYPSGATPVAPINGAIYSVNSPLGTGIVVSAGSATTFSTNFLSGGTTYDFYVYAYNSSQCFSPLYRGTSPLQASLATQSCSSLAAGTYSVGPTGTYTNLGAALAATANGIIGNVVFELQNSYTSTGETFPLTFASSACSINGNITIRPQTGATGLVISSANVTATLDFNGGDQFIIDGRPGGTGTTSQLSVVNTSTTGVAVRFINDAQRNTLTYLDIQGQNTTVPVAATPTLAGVVYFGTAFTGGGVTSLGNDKNTISNSSIHGTPGNTPAIGIFGIGTNLSVAAYNDSITIVNNNIYDFFSAGGASCGVLFDIGTNACTISGNSFYETASVTTTAANFHRAIWITANTTSGTVSNTASGFIVNDNYIGGSAPLAGGAPMTILGAFQTTFQGIDLTVGLGTPTSVQNNTIRNMTIFTANGSGFIGIQQANGHVNIGTVTGNTVGSQTAAGDIMVTNTAGAGGIVLGYRVFGGTGTLINIANNTFGGLTTASTASTIGQGIQGIAVGGGAKITVTNNIIGSPATANSIYATATSTSNAQSVTGIIVTSGNSTLINGNTIANLNNEFTGTGNGQTRGIVVQNGATIITNNTIRNLSNAANQVGTGSSAAVLGIVSITGGLPAAEVTGNTIHSLSATGTTTTAQIWVTGIHYSGTTSVMGTIAKNLIHSFDMVAPSTAAVMNGIEFSSGTATIANNMVRLGIRPNGTSLTNAQLIRGIVSASTTTANNFYYNSVYIGGTGVASNINNTYAFLRTATSGTYDIRNNIFVNNRSLATTGGKQYAAHFSVAMTGVSIDYNVYQAIGTGGIVAWNGSTDFVTYTPGWYASDIHSLTGNPLYANATGAASAVDLHLTAGSIAEGVGTAISSVTDDIDGQARSGLTPTDIGADAGNYGATGVDVGAAFLVSPFTGGCGTASQSVVVRIKNYAANTINFATNPVTVTVNGTGAVTYSSNVVINTGTLVPGATLDVTLPATVNTTAAGTYIFNANTSVTGDANALNDAMTVTNVVIVAGTSLSGTYTVGTGGAYTTLSAAVAAYNSASCLGGNVEFSLIDGLYNTTTGETFPIRINQVSNPNNYTLTIRPATGVNPTIVSMVDSAVIKLVGADNIIIDGSNNSTSSRNLTIQNNKAGAQAAGVWVASLGGAGNGAVNNTIKNTNFTGGSATQNSLSGIYGVVSSANNSMTVGNADNDNLAVTNNAISKATVGISAVGTIMSQDGLVISNNVIGSNNASDYVNGIGIGYAYANNALISGNTIFNIITLATNTNTATGIEIGAGVMGGSIINNNISKVYQPNVSGVRASGIIFSTTGTDGVTVANNMISDVKTVKFSNPSANNAAGIYIPNGTNLKVVHNTINMFGSITTGTGTGFSANVYIATAVTNLDFRNNILVNTQDFGINTSAAYNVFISGSGFFFSNSNYNDYYGSTAGSTVYRVGFDNAIARPTLNDWRLFTNQDLNSIAILPPFNSPTDLHMDIALGTAMDNKGTPVGILADIDGDSRNLVTPDIGADEFTVVTGIDFGVKSLVSPAIQQCYSNSETVSVRIRNYSTNTHNFALIPVTVKASAAGPNPQTFVPVIVNTGTLAPGDSLLVMISNNYDMSVQGTYTFNTYTIVSADVQAPNDTLVTTRTLTVTTSGTVSAPITQYCLNGSPTLTLTGSNGSTIQWQSAPGASGPWTNVGTNSNVYLPSPVLTATTHFRAYVVCNANSDTSNVKVINVDNPQILSTTPVTRCGPGTMSLNATASAGSTLNWYATATGGTSLASGSTYTTPLISNTTTYYVAAQVTGSSSTVGIAPTSTLCGTQFTTTLTGWALRFNLTTVPVTINSAWVIPVSAGTFTVGIGSALTGTPTQTFNYTFTAAQVGVPQQININYTITTPGNYQMWNVAGGISRIGIFTCNYPFTSAAGGFSIVGGASSPTGTTSLTQYNSFFDINVSEGCESNRQAVTATVTPAPAFDVTNNLTVCNNAITTLQVNSTVANFNTYVWTPVSGLFTNATATTAYTAGTNASTVYEKITTPGTYTFIAQANNTTTGCQNFDSVKVTVLPAAITVIPTPDQLCMSGTSTLIIVPDPGTFGAAQYQWQSSSNNTVYTNIPSATGISYNTPTITATTYYKIDLKNSAGVSCTTAYDTVIVNSPAILSTTPAALCGPGTMNLAATATPGATINWYSAATGGAILGNGGTFTTPNLATTTTYYAGATTGSSGFEVGVRVADFALCGFPVTTSGTDLPIRFTTTKSVVINSAWVIPASAGTLTVALRAAGSATNIGTPVNIPITAAMVGTPQLIPLGIVVSTPGNYQLTNTSIGLWRITTLGCGYPFNTPTGGFSITGSATSSTVAASTTFYNGFYQLSVSEGCESPRVPVVAQVSPVTAITLQPLPNISTCVGASINLVVNTVGANVVYQWRKNNVNIANSNNDTLTLNPVALTDAGTYDVVITGLCGNATSTVATVNVSAANTWVGTVSTDWNNAANWCGGIPTQATDVAIFSGTPFQPVINAAVANARTIAINNGASLIIQPNGILNLYGDFVNNGSFVASNAFVFFKGATNQNVASMNVGNIVVNGTSGITLTGGMSVGTSTVLTNGNITLGVNNLTLSGDVTGNLASHIVTNSSGSVISKNITNTSVTIPVGPNTSSYNPVYITNGDGRDYAVRVSTGLSPTISNPGLAVNRTWSINANTTPASPVKIEFQYEDGHMNTPGVPTNAMEIGVHTGTSWTVAVNSSTPVGTSTQRKVGGNFSQFGPMVVSNIGGIGWITSAPAPVDPTVSSVSLLPNPVETSAVLRVVSTRTAQIRWNVIDGQGRTVMSFDRSVLQGQNDIPLQLQHLAAGIYHLTGTTDKGLTTVVKFVKQ